MQKQKGISIVSLLFLVVTIGLYTLLLAKFLPIYIDNYTVKSIMRDLQSRPEITSSNDSVASAVRTYLQKSFAMNNIHDIKADSIKITPTGDGADIDAGYEVRVNIVGNIDAIVTFNNTAKVRIGGEK